MQLRISEICHVHPCWLKSAISLPALRPETKPWLLGHFDAKIQVFKEEQVGSFKQFQVNTAYAYVP